MNYHKRMIGIALLLGCVSAVVIYATADVGVTEHLQSFRPWAVGLALVFWAIGMYFDCTRLVLLVEMANRHITLKQSLTVILSNYFLAMLTPGATGGPVAQVLVLKELGVSAGCATVLVLVRTMLSIVFLAVSAPLVLWLDGELSEWMPIEGVIAIAVGMLAMLIGGLLTVQTRVMRRLVLWCIRRLTKRRRRNIWRMYRDVGAVSTLIVAAPCKMIRVLADTAISLLALYAMVPSLFLGLGIEVDWITILGRMILLNLVLYFAPTPGGSGVAEGGFIYLFEEFLPHGTVGVLAVMWRILAEYLPFGLGMYYSLKIVSSRLLTKAEQAIW